MTYDNTISRQLSDFYREVDSLVKERYPDCRDFSTRLEGQILTVNVHVRGEETHKLNLRVEVEPETNEVESITYIDA